MAGLDILLAESLRTIIEQNLGKSTYEKINNRLEERYGIDVVEAIKDFYKIDATLREFFGSGADEIERNFLNDFISLGPSNKDTTWITIHNQSLANLILESIGNPDKRVILNNSMQQPQIILNIIKKCNLPKSSGYRMIKELVNEGFLTKRGFSIANDGRRLYKYISLFKDVKIDIQEKKILVKIQINKDFIKNSLIANMIINQ